MPVLRREAATPWVTLEQKVLLALLALDRLQRLSYIHKPRPEYNQQRFGPAIDLASHPSLKERKRHIEQMVTARQS